MHEEGKNRERENYIEPARSRWGKSKEKKKKSAKRESEKDAPAAGTWGVLDFSEAFP